MSPFLGFKNKLALMLLDTVLLVAAAYLVTYLRLQVLPEQLWLQWPFWVLAFGVLTGLYVFGSYDLDQGLSKRDLLIKQVGSLIFSLLSLVILNYVLFIDRSGVFGRGILFGTTFLFFLISFSYRLVISRIFNRMGGRLKWLVLIDDDNRKYFEADLGRLGFLGQVDYLNPSLISKDELKAKLQQAWSAVVIGLKHGAIEASLLETLMKVKFRGQRVMDLSQFYEKNWFKVPIYYLDPEWFIASEGFQKISQPLAIRIKRIFDIVLATIIFMLAWPLMLLTAFAIKVESPGGVIYRQIRTGKHGKDFYIYKFRSMRSDAEKAGAQWAQKNDARITRVGQFIRKTRLDELPQLWNVIKGDMSFVGPRPERPEFNEMLAEQINFYHLRHTMQPGLTGWAQVLYPYGASVEDAREKLQYELFYAKHFNLMMDLYIFLKTIRVVLFGRGR